MELIGVRTYFLSVVVDPVFYDQARVIHKVCLVVGDQRPPKKSDRVRCDELVQSIAHAPLGRADALVKILGELVDPEAVERELVSISEGRLTPGTFAIIAIPDERAGSALVPVFESSVNSEAAETALSIYQNRAPGFRRLTPLAVVEKLPRSELGKLRRNELVEIYLNQITR